MSSNQDFPTMILRPYQVLCLICCFGERDSGPMERQLQDALETIRKNPDTPIELRCNVGEVFEYQDPGTADDTSEGSEYNRKRDLDILTKLDLFPGSILPARILVQLVLKTIPTVSGVCAYKTVTSESWRGCAKAGCGYYERGREKGIHAVISPRGEKEMARDKEASLRDLYQAEVVAIRPHILLCAAAQYGTGIRPPFKDDNLPEMLQLFLQQPEKPVALVRGADWMMCAPCPSRVSKCDGCVCGQFGSGGLLNELKDLNVLQRLGLRYGTTMKARDMYGLLFGRIESVESVCALAENHPESSVWCGDQEWWCNAKPVACPQYQKGRELLVKKLGLW